MSADGIPLSLVAQPVNVLTTLLQTTAALSYNTPRACTALHGTALPCIALHISQNLHILAFCVFVNECPNLSILRCCQAKTLLTSVFRF